MLLRLARKSLWNRRGTAVLCVLSIAISVFILLSVEFIRQEAKASFGRTLTGADLVVGARSGQLNLLLYSLFRLGDPTNNIRWGSYEDIAADPSVAWTIPLSLGDSHRGFRVLGTTAAYFRYYRFGSDRALSPMEGRAEIGGMNAVIGANVASTLKYSIGQQIVLAHGTGRAGFHHHEDHPLTVAGVLKATGTPVDDTVHVSLEAIDLIHEGVDALPAQAAERTITAFIVGLHSRVQALRMQRAINDYAGEPLQAILPGVSLSQLWRVLGTVENVLRLISALVILSALLGMSTILLASLRERRGEIAILRTVGASPAFIFLLLQTEAMLLAAVGAAVGVAAVAGAALAGGDWLRERYGLFLSFYVPGTLDLLLVAMVIGAGMLCAILPAVGAYRASLGQGAESI